MVRLQRRTQGVQIVKSLSSKGTPLADGSSMRAQLRFAVLLSGLAVFGCGPALGCGPRLPPTTVPAPLNPGYQPFAQALQRYVDQTQPFRKQAAQEAER